MTNNIILFGSTGMLGSYCLKILRNDYNIVPITRKEYDIMDNNYDNLFNIINSYSISI